LARPYKGASRVPGGARTADIQAATKTANKYKRRESRNSHGERNWIGATRAVVVRLAPQF